MARRKCLLRACPHYHYSLDSIGGAPVKPHPFPKTSKMWFKWQEFVILHNGSFEEPQNQHFLCSAHFTPSQFEKSADLKPGALPTVAPEIVREIALRNGDVSHPKPYQLPVKKHVEKENAGQVVILEELKGCGQEKQYSRLHDSHSSGSSPPCQKRQRLDLSPSDFVNPEKSKFAIQLVNAALLKIWCGEGIMNKNKKVSDPQLVRGKEIEVVANCSGSCYRQ